MSRPQVAGYEVQGLLGEGASAVVWRAVRLQDGAPVALKVSRQPLRATDPWLSGWAVTPRDAESVLAELAWLRTARLDGVVPLHDALVLADDRLVLVLGLAEGGSLADLVRTRGHLVAQEATTILAAVARTMLGLHRQGIAHGDLSPGNVLLDAQGHALVADLGTAAVIGDLLEDPWGTAGFVAPELDLQEEVTAAADVWSLGALGWHMLTGEPRRTATDLAELAARVPDAPTALIDLITRCLAPRPGDRPLMRDVCEELTPPGDPQDAPHEPRPSADAGTGQTIARATAAGPTATGRARPQDVPSPRVPRATLRIGGGPPGIIQARGGERAATGGRLPAGAETPRSGRTLQGRGSSPQESPRSHGPVQPPTQPGAAAPARPPRPSGAGGGSTAPSTADVPSGPTPGSETGAGPRQVPGTVDVGLQPRPEDVTRRIREQAAEQLRALDEARAAATPEPPARRPFLTGRTLAASVAAGLAVGVVGAAWWLDEDRTSSAVVVDAASVRSTSVPPASARRSAASRPDTPGPGPTSPRPGPPGAAVTGRPTPGTGTGTTPGAALSAGATTLAVDPTGAVQELLDARAAALVTQDRSVLARADAVGSWAWRSDTARIAELRRRGQTQAGLRFEVTAARAVRVGEQEVVVRADVALGPWSWLADGRRTQEPGHPATEADYVLRRTPAGWRLAGVEQPIR
ncbi:protein kinase domain-containing protein [Arsenicicoccus dermatophilus]|uniref:protein kinase domain-containing protein n=1 Tax=Arsenicicoccus dermatophilus TaxID=1076331 RepID=UPI0039172E99